MTNLAVAAPTAIYDRLMAAGDGSENTRFLASMLSSWLVGGGALPAWLGLSEKAYQGLLYDLFPDYDGPTAAEKLQLVDAEREDERGEVRQLLLGHRAGNTDIEILVAEIVAAGCQAMDHLWQDLGLFCRDDLSKMLLVNFPTLARLNDRNMKWKKFIYKQLCLTEGIYTCRSPSCEVCADYDNCFGPEE